MSGFKVPIDICLACGVELNSENWHKFNSRKRFFRCRICFNKRLPQNKDIVKRVYNSIIRNCKDCDIKLIENKNWNISAKESSIFKCKNCSVLKEKIRQEKTKYSILKKLEIKNEVFDLLGYKCNCCDENNWTHLTVDHILENGSTERGAKKNGDKYSNIYWYIHLTKDINSYQTLCMNCNYSKGNYGFCSHTLLNENNCTFCSCNLNKNNMFEIDFIYNKSICKDCSTKKSIRSDIINQKQITEKSKRLNLKQEIIENYEGKCSCCLESDPYFLTIDHILIKGRQHVKSIGGGFYSWLKKNNFPKDDFQLLCYNCNCSKGLYGQCHHQLLKKHNTDLITIDDYKQLIINNQV